MSVGRKRTPTILKLLKGNPGRRPLPKGEPRLPACVPDRPAELSVDECRAWSDLVAALTPMRVLTIADGILLELMAIELASYRRAAQDVRERGEILTSKRGAELVNPWLRARAASHKRVFQMLGACGLTPADRSKVIASPDVDGGSPFGQF